MLQTLYHVILLGLGGGEGKTSTGAGMEGMKMQTLTTDNVLVCFSPDPVALVCS